MKVKVTEINEAPWRGFVRPVNRITGSSALPPPIETRRPAGTVKVPVEPVVAAVEEAVEEADEEADEAGALGDVDAAKAAAEESKIPTDLAALVVTDTNSSAVPALLMIAPCSCAEV